MRDGVDRLERRCLDLAAGLGPRPMGPIHRDFYPDQLLIAEDQVTVIDFDLYCEGDPALDIGNFVAHLSELALRERGDVHALDAARHECIEVFLALSDPGHRQAVETYDVLSMARLVGLSVQLPGRSHTTEALLAVLT